MKRALEFLTLNKKWLWLLPYLSAILWMWSQRSKIPAPLGAFTRDTIVIALSLTGLICLVDLLHRPWFMAWKVKRTFERAGLRNAQKELPALRCVREDRAKAHGHIIEIYNKGISIPDFDEKNARLEASLNGIIYGMEYGRNSKITRLYLLPRRYVRPTFIFSTDEAIGRIAVQQLINLLVIGATGTGKTVAIKILMAKIAKYQPDAKIWLLDFKRFDFRDFANLPLYYGYTDCVQGLNNYYEAFKMQQEAGAADATNYLVIDEWGSFIMSLEKKEAEQLKGKLAELLMLGRAYRFFPIIGIQRPDAAYFASSRDNFQTCLALGNLSPEGRRMIFPDSTARQIVECRKREGHLYIDGMGLEKVRIADIPDMASLDTTIREAMCR